MGRLRSIIGGLHSDYELRSVTFIREKEDEGFLCLGKMRSKDNSNTWLLIVCQFDNTYSDTKVLYEIVTDSESLSANFDRLMKEYSA